jgi:hypothetical protein
MRFPRTGVTAVAAALGTAGCSYGYDIYAVFDGTKLLFDTHAEESRYAAGLCIDDLEVRSGSSLIWAIERETPRPDATCPNDFPVAYSSPPPGFRSTTPAERLRPGVLYEVSGHGNASFEGSFRYSVRKVVTVQNQEE